MTPVCEIRNVITQTQKTDEEIFREEGLERRIERSKDLRKDVEIAFNKHLAKMRLQNNSLNKADAAATMTKKMRISSPTFLASFIWGSSTNLKTIRERYLQRMQTFFNLQLAPKIRKQLTTLFPVEKEKLTVASVNLIPSLVKDIEKVFDDFVRLNPESNKKSVKSVSIEMGLPEKGLYKILKGIILSIKSTQIKSIRTFAEDNFKNVENNYPILFSEKLLEVDNDTLFVNSEASDPALPIQDSVSNFETSDNASNASKTNPNKKRSFDQSENSNDEVNPQHRKKPLIPVEIRNDIKKGYELCRDLSPKNTMNFLSKKMQLPTDKTLFKIINPRSNGIFKIKNLSDKAYEGIKAAFVEILTLEVCKKELTALFPPSLDDFQVFIGQNSVNNATEGVKTNEISQENNIATFTKGVGFWDVEQYINITNDYEGHDDLPDWSREDNITIQNFH